MSNIVNAGIRITRDCNLKCPYCNIQSIKKKELSLEEWKKVGVIIKKIGITDLVILGGEPTEYYALKQFISFYEKELNIRCSMTTNAYNNYDKVIDVIDAGLSKIGLSIDNLDTTKSISPLKNKMGLELLNKLIILNKNIQIIDYVVLSKRNIDNIEELIEYMSNNNVFTYFLPFHHSNEGEYEHRKNNQSNAFISEEDILKYNKAIDKIISMKKKGFLISNSIEFLTISKKYIKNLNWKCTGLSELRIDSDGKMLCCCDKIGDVNNKYSIFDLDNFEKFNEFISDRNFDSSMCQGCLWPSSIEAEIRRNNFFNDNML